MRRVVVTGVGLVTPLGCGSDAVFNRLLDGACGVSRLQLSEEQQGLIPPNISVAARVPRSSSSGSSHSTEGNVLLYATNKELVAKRQQNSSSSLFIDYALYAADCAMNHAGIESLQAAGIDAERAGVAIGNGGIGSLPDITASDAALHNSYRKLSPYFVPKVLVNMAAGQVSLKFGLKGPVHSVATACAAGAHSVGDAFNFIRLGYADFMLAGGCDASIDPLAIAGFARMKALATTPADADTGDSQIHKQSRPFHEKRNGFVLGEGAGVLVLEELHCALRRGAHIIAELRGYGLSGDAHHATAPAADGDGARRSMQSALHDAQLPPSAVGYINAHATSTPLGDAAEISAIRSVFRDSRSDSNNISSNSIGSNISKSSGSTSPLLVSSTKGATGHLLGAAGAVEAAFTAMAVSTGRVPATLHLDAVDAALRGDAVFQHVAERSVHCAELRHAISNSFGFGGTNVSLLFSKWEPDT